MKKAVKHNLHQALLIACLLLNGLISYGQDNNSADTILADNYYNKATQFKNNYAKDSAIFYALKASDIYIKYFGYNSLKNAKVLQLLGTACYDASEYNKTLEYWTETLNIRLKLLGSKHSLVAKSYNNLGVLYHDLSDYDKAMECYKKSLEIRLALFGENNEDVAASYSNMSIVFEETGEFDKALEYSFKGLQIRLGLFGEKNIDVASSYCNIGIAYYDKSDYNKALEYYLKEVAISEELLGDSTVEIAGTYNNIGAVYDLLKEYDKALSYHFKSLAIFLRQLGENSTLVADDYNNIGIIYRHQHEYDKALSCLFKSLDIYRQLLGEKHVAVVLCYENIGDLYRDKELAGNALKYYQKGIVSCLRNFSDTVNCYTVPAVSDYIKWNDLMYGLLTKAQILADTTKFLQGINSRERLDIALKHYMACDSLIRKVRREITTQSDKIDLGELAGEVCNGALLTCEILARKSTRPEEKQYYSELCFSFSEKSKMAVLLEALAGKEAQKFAGIPDTLLSEEQLLQSDIAYYIKKLAESENSDSTNLYKYKSGLFDANRSYDSLIAVFEKQFPKYHELKYNDKSISARDIRQKLDKNTALLSYSIGDSSVTIFILTRKSLEIRQVKTPAFLADTIELYRKSLLSPKKRMLPTYRNIAFRLYQLFFPEFPGQQIKNLIIIPDNVLSTIPFETLLTEKTAENTSLENYPFLIRKYNISYSYSATLFYHTFPKARNPKVEVTAINDWIAIAPVFHDDKTAGSSLRSAKLVDELHKLESDSGLTRGILMTHGDYIQPLPGTETEVKNIFGAFDQMKYKASVELNDNASERLVKSGMLEKYKIIHFATHGFVNSESPELSGILLAQVADSLDPQNDGILYSGEIYNLKLKANLVILSACETGLGKIKKGEGIIGLTRALLYAGAQNIVVSLWQVADESTSTLMLDFYSEILKIGLKNPSFSTSLRKAKLKMIAKKTYAHPFYWSPFILIGK